MGKQKTKELKAFNSAESLRKTLINQLNKCNSQEDLDRYVKRYEEQKKKNSSPVCLTSYHQQIISGLDAKINELHKQLTARFATVDSTEPLLISDEPHEGVEGTSLVTAHGIPVDLTIENPLHEKQDLSTLQTQSETSLEPSKKQGGSEIPNRTTVRRSVTFKIDEHPKSMRDFTEDKHTQENNVDARTKRHRNVQLLEVRVKLRTLHSKQTKYEEKAKEYSKKNDPKNQEKYQNAAKAAKSIYHQITQLTNRYVLDGNLMSFKIDSQKILSKDNEHVKTLRTHRGWWEQFLDDLVARINAGFTRIGSSMRLPELSMFKPAADGGKKITELSNEISSIKVTV